MFGRADEQKPKRMRRATNNREEASSAVGWKVFGLFWLPLNHGLYAVLVVKRFGCASFCSTTVTTRAATFGWALNLSNENFFFFIVFPYERRERLSMPTSRPFQRYQLSEGQALSAKFRAWRRSVGPFSSSLLLFRPHDLQTKPRESNKKVEEWELG